MSEYKSPHAFYIVTALALASWWLAIFLIQKVFAWLFLTMDDFPRGDVWGASRRHLHDRDHAPQFQLQASEPRGHG